MNIINFCPTCARPLAYDDKIGLHDAIIQKPETPYQTKITHYIFYCRHEIEITDQLRKLATGTTWEQPKATQ